MKLRGSVNRSGIIVETYTKSTCSHSFYLFFITIYFEINIFWNGMGTSSGCFFFFFFSSVWRDLIQRPLLKPCWWQTKRFFEDVPCLLLLSKSVYNILDGILMVLIPAFGYLGKQIHVTVDKTVVKQELRLLNLSADYRSPGFISPVPCKWSSRRLAGTSSSTCFSEPVCPSGKGRGWQAKGHNSVRTDLFLQQVLVHWHCLVVTLFLCC